jgi:hypothetical protein
MAQSAQIRVSGVISNSHVRKLVNSGWLVREQQNVGTDVTGMVNLDVLSQYLGILPTCAVIARIGPTRIKQITQAS